MAATPAATTLYVTAPTQGGTNVHQSDDRRGGRCSAYRPDCRCRCAASCPAGPPGAPPRSQPRRIHLGRTYPSHLASDDHPTGTHVSRATTAVHQILGRDLGLIAR